MSRTSPPPIDNPPEKNLTLKKRSLACERCGHERLVAFSRKRPGFCPACVGRRMSDTALHLVERVFPEVPIRQWVCSLIPQTLARTRSFRSVLLRARPVRASSPERIARPRGRSAGARSVMAVPAPRACGAVRSTPRWAVLACATPSAGDGVRRALRIWRTTIAPAASAPPRCPSARHFGER